MKNSIEVRPRLTRKLRKAAVAVFAMSALSAAIQPVAAQTEFNSLVGGERIEFTVDVAEDMNKFVWTPVKPADKEPVRGSFFVTEGNIYRAGTITGDPSRFDPNTPGAFGRWLCSGTFLVPASAFPNSAVAVLTDQFYSFPDDQRSIATTGTEGNGLALRGMTAGTGPFAGYVGEQRQQFLGFNKSGGVSLRVTFTLRKAIKN